VADGTAGGVGEGKAVAGSSVGTGDGLAGNTVGGGAEGEVLAARLAVGVGCGPQAPRSNRLANRIADPNRARAPPCRLNPMLVSVCCGICTPPSNYVNLFSRSVAAGLAVHDPIIQGSIFPVGKDSSKRNSPVLLDLPFLDDMMALSLTS
jgi:hypothetical protein